MFINPKWQIINNERIGVFYIEPYDETLREEPDRIKVYDSDGRYFSYVPDIDLLPLSFEKYDKIVTLLRQAKNVIEVFNIVGEPGGEYALTILNKWATRYIPTVKGVHITPLFGKNRRLQNDKI